MRTISAVAAGIAACAATLQAQRADSTVVGGAVVGGAVVHTVAADSIVPTAPIATLSQLLNGRVAGLAALSEGGDAGAGSVLYLRGQDQASGLAGPLVIVDGVRVDNSQRNDSRAVADHPATVRFDDLDPAEIEHIDVLPGAAAAALYGPGAGNGVIFVSTRRASRRTVSANITADGSVVTTPLDMADSYHSFGHGDTTNGCLLAQRASGACTLDSVVHFNPLNSGVTSPLHSVLQDRVGASLGLGVGPVRLEVGGHYTDQTGTLRMPAPDIPLYTSGFGAAPSDMVRQPDHTARGDVRGSLTANLGAAADVTLSAGYVNRDQRAPDIDNVLIDGALGSGIQTVDDGWAGSHNRPWIDLADVSTDHASHTTLGLQGNLRPSRALAIHATAGSDAVVERWGDVFSEPPAPGGTIFFNAAARERVTRYLADVNGTLNERVAPLIRSRVTFGAQYLLANYSDTAFSEAGLNQVFSTTTQEVKASSLTQGLYLTDALTLNDRVVVAGGARWDHQRIHATGLSSSSLNPSVTTRMALVGTAENPQLQVRGALGQTTSLPDVRELTPINDGLISMTTGGAAYRVRPSRQRELEAGADLLAPGGVFSLGVTIYARRSTNVLIDVPVQSQFWIGSVPGEYPWLLVSNRGAELTAMARLVNRKTLVWDATLNASENTNKALHASGSGGTAIGGPIALRHPIGSAFGNAYTYADANHDGVIESDEVTSTGYMYVGPTTPTRLASLSTSVRLLGGRLRVAALVDYRGGYVLPDNVAREQSLLGTLAASNVSGTSLADQARAVAITNNPFNSVALYERVNAVRWRELSVTAAVPRLSAVQVTLAARNLWLHTNYTGGDPDQFLPPSLNNSGSFVLPQPRTFLLRVSAGI